MSWLNSLLSNIAPQYALKREIAQRRLNRVRTYKPRSNINTIGVNIRGSGVDINNISNEFKRSFDAASGNRTKYDVLQPHNSADSAIANEIKTLRNQIRQLEYNSGDIAGPLKRLVDNIVGNGIKFQARVKAENRSDVYSQITQSRADKFNQEAEKYFKIWSKKADASLRLNFYELQRLIVKAFIRDGEVLVIGRNSNKSTRIIPYCQSVLEIDRLSTPTEEITNPKIRHGIEYDNEGCPIRYYILKEHPGESLTLGGFRANDYEEIDAFNANGTQKVFHVFDPSRPEQSRGYPLFASALKIILDKDRYKEAEILAALEDACLTGIIKATNPIDFQGAWTTDNIENDDGETGNQRIHEFSPGAKWYLGQNEDFEGYRPSRPNTHFEAFLKQLDREAANGSNIIYEMFSQDWAGMNYSNARTVLLQFYTMCRCLQTFVIDHYCQPTYENVLSDLIAVGLVRAPSFRDKKEEYFSSLWIPPGWSWVDPVKEAKGKETEINNNFETLTDICAAKGKDFDEVAELRAKELRKLKDLEEQFDIKFSGSNNNNNFEQDNESNLEQQEEGDKNE